MKRPIRRRQYHKQLVNLLPEPARNNLAQDVGQLRHEIIGLRAENESLRPFKTEAATLRASMMDAFYEQSEPDSGEPQI